MEMNEMHSYIGSKKACWMWIAVYFLCFGVSRWFDGEKTGESSLQCGSRPCDDGRPYTSFVPHWQHIPFSQAQTFTMEGCKSLFSVFSV